jgi:hypothetical protein
MPINEHLIQVKLSPENRKRIDLLRAVLTHTNPSGLGATWNDCVAFLLESAPVEQWLIQIATGANKGKEHERSAEGTSCGGTDGIDPDGNADNPEHASSPPGSGEERNRKVGRKPGRKKQHRA